MSKHKETAIREFDYLVVGAGSAGCAVAARLSEDPTISVALIEAGPADTNPFIHMPLGVLALLNSKKLNWQFQTASYPACSNRSLYWPRGRMLGGSSSMNGMLYVRGHAKDYDDWAELGCEGWSYADVLPYFKRMEHNESLQDDYHGQDGPLNVSDCTQAYDVDKQFVAAAAECGHTINPDFNGAEQEGFGWYQHTVKDGERWSAARAYLTPNTERQNLHILTDTQVTAITLDGKRATGISAHQKGKLITLNARREVILCGGAVNSPQLLLLSGIGPADELNQHDIPIQHDLPGVGKNLQDHVDILLVNLARKRTGFSVAPSFWPKLFKGLIDYASGKRDGLMSKNVAEVGGFWKSDPKLERPDIQYHFFPTALQDHGRKFIYKYGYSLHSCVLRPKSAGSISLNSADPLASPKIDPGYFSDPRDMPLMIKAFKHAREILAAAAFDEVRGAELAPGENIQTDEQIETFIRERAETIYHPVGSCKMGNDEMAVVDPQLRVHGLKGLRVADASIMPTLIGGNTNAPSIMVGEVCADLILRRRLQPEKPITEAQKQSPERTTA